MKPPASRRKPDDDQEPEEHHHEEVLGRMKSDVEHQPGGKELSRGQEVHREACNRNAEPAPVIPRPVDSFSERCRDPSDEIAK